MKAFFVGELIKKRRIELGLTQEQLCEGICEPVTISRLENGRQTPSMNKLRALLQRLGMPEDKYYALLNKNEMQISVLQTEIESVKVLKDTKRGLAKIAELEEIIDQNDTMFRQYILQSKVCFGQLEHGQIIPYSFEEKLDILFQAIRLTVPNFDIEEICKGLYSLDEIKIIHQIGTLYSNEGQSKKTIDIYCQLLEYIKKHFDNIFQSNGLLSLISYNYARELRLVERYENSIEIASLGWQSCVRYGQYTYLPQIIALMAECYHFLDQDKKSKDYYHQAYYLLKAIGNERSIATVKSDARKYFGPDFLFS